MEVDLRPAIQFSLFYIFTQLYISDVIYYDLYCGSFSDELGLVSFLHGPYKQGNSSTSQDVFFFHLATFGIGYYELFRLVK